MDFIFIPYGLGTMLKMNLTCSPSLFFSEGVFDILHQCFLTGVTIHISLLMNFVRCIKKHKQ